MGFNKWLTFLFVMVCQRFVKLVKLFLVLCIQMRFDGSTLFLFLPWLALLSLELYRFCIGFQGKLNPNMLLKLDNIEAFWDVFSVVGYYVDCHDPRSSTSGKPHI
jgi:hypothetical protein